MALNPPQFALSRKNRIWVPADGRRYSSPSCFFPLFSQGLSLRSRSTTVAAAKKENKSISNRKKDDGHSFASKPDEATGPFPEAVLLKEVSFYAFIFIHTYSLCIYFTCDVLENNEH